MKPTQLMPQADVLTAVIQVLEPGQGGGGERGVKGGKGRGGPCDRCQRYLNRMICCMHASQRRGCMGAPSLCFLELEQPLELVDALSLRAREEESS